MDNKVTHKVPMGQKIAFGVGMFANQMFPAILGIFMVVLVQDLKFTGILWGMIYLFPRLFDAITDPIMGFISDNTKSKWGRRRKYVLLGGIVMGISYIFMWQLFKENSVMYNFWYFFLWSLVFYFGLTLFSVPYVAMGYEMSDDFHERTNIMAIAQFIGQWAWVIAPWFWVIMYDPEWFPSADVAARKLAIWVAIPCAICAIIPAFFIKSESTLTKNYEPLNASNIGNSLKSIFKSFSEAFKIKEFRKLCGATFLIFNAFNTVAALTFFVIVYKLFNGDAGASGVWVSLFGCIGALGTTFIVIPVVAWMSKMYGKKKAFMISQSISVFGYILLYFLFIPGKPWMYIFALPFFSFGIGSLFTIMMSMTADVIDLDELNTGKRREGIFGAIYWWMVKVGFAIAGALSGLIISIVGFNADLPTTEQQTAVDGLHAFFCFFPAIGTLIAMYVMKDYNLNEKRANTIRKELDKRKEQLNNPYPYSKNSLLDTSEFKNIADNEISNISGIDFKSLNTTEKNQIFKEILQNKMHGICFSAYESRQKPGYSISEEQITKRVQILQPYTKWIRTFSSTNGHENIPKIAKNLGLKTMVGAWISNDKEKNDKEIKNLIQNINNGWVDIAVIGNETLYRKETTESELISYIEKVRKELKVEVPISTVEIYSELIQNTKLIDHCDVVLLNAYPFWEGYPLKHSGLYLKKIYEELKKNAKGKKVIITETGWPTAGETIDEAIPSKENALQYFIDTQQWANKNDIEIYHFSSFDEEWKVTEEGQAGAHWGLFNTNGELKF